MLHFQSGGTRVSWKSGTDSIVRDTIYPAQTPDSLIRSAYELYANKYKGKGKHSVSEP